MGQARMKILEAGKIVQFDFSAPAVHVPGEDITPSRATRVTIASAVNAKFPQGMDRRDGKVWAAWQEIIDDEADTVDMPMSQVEWLHKILGSDDLKLMPQLAQWREAVVNYLDRLKPEEA